MRSIKPKISLTIHTASPDNFLESQGIPSAAACLIDCLNHQEFTEFELVYVDGNYDENAARVSALPAKFVVKHVPVHPAHRYAYDRKHVWICAGKNTGLLYADGELIVWCDDAEIFPPNFLKMYWHYYKEEGRYLHAAHRRFRSLKIADGLPVYPIDGDQYINDTRHYDGNVFRHEDGGWLYAGTSAALDHALTINGFNSRMDLTKGAEDCEFGTRLQLTGGKFVLDRNVWLGIIDHPNYMTFNRQTYLTAIENYSMICCARELEGFIVANLPNQINDLAMNIIRRETIKYRNFDPLAPDHANDWAIWMGAPSFNLREQRDELRKSSDWKWNKPIVDPLITHQDIPGWFDFADIYKSAVDRASDNEIFIEIGAWLGRSAAYMGECIRESGKQITFYAVDTFKGSPDEPVHASEVDKQGGSILKAFKTNMERCGLSVQAIVGDSVESASLFSGKSVAFAFIDACHSYDAVKADILAWLPKVKPGGTLAGHDYYSHFTGVKEAVDELLPNIQTAGSSWIYNVPVNAVEQKRELPAVAKVVKPVIAPSGKRPAITLNDYFDKIFCINLKKRRDRWQQVLEQCWKHNITLERFEAHEVLQNGKPHGVMGCLASHRALLDIIAYNGWNRALILEDDFLFRYDDSQQRFSDMIGDVPSDWDILYLGGQYAAEGQVAITPHVIRAGRMHGCNAYGVTKEFARAQAPYCVDAPIDVIYANCCDLRKYYCFVPRLAIQMPGFSDIEEKVTDNTWAYTDTRHEKLLLDEVGSSRV